MRLLSPSPSVDTPNGVAPQIGCGFSKSRRYGHARTTAHHPLARGPQHHIGIKPVKLFWTNGKAVKRIAALVRVQERYGDWYVMKEEEEDMFFYYNAPDWLTTVSYLYVATN